MPLQAVVLADSFAQVRLARRGAALGSFFRAADRARARTLPVFPSDRRASPPRPLTVARLPPAPRTLSPPPPLLAALPPDHARAPEGPAPPRERPDDRVHARVPRLERRRGGVCVLLRARRADRRVPRVQRVVSDPGFVVHTIVSTNCISAGEAMRLIDHRHVIRADFVLVHGDVVANADLRRAIDAHKRRRAKDKLAMVTMCVKPLTQRLREERFGGQNLVFVTDPDTDRVLHYEEHAAPSPPAPGTAASLRPATLATPAPRARRQPLQRPPAPARAIRPRGLPRRHMRPRGVTPLHR